ncbi:hypothetical protein HJD18_11950 [Thermoleophilia bacterium SCSIO 60948]|nr:hypothetical protein HJD18_11950 [Thermoleophilia bacterium SCSIO 60948]
MNRRLRLPSPAMIIALLALFVGLSAGAYAATKVAPGSVGTKQLKNGAVTDAKVASDRALAKAWGRVLYINADNPAPKVDRKTSSGIAVTEAQDEGGQTINGVSCVSIRPKFDVVTATGNDAAGAASPDAYVSVNYTPTSSGYVCPDNADVRVETFNALNDQNRVVASYSIVAH